MLDLFRFVFVNGIYGLFGIDFLDICSNKFATNVNTVDIEQLFDLIQNKYRLAKSMANLQ